MSDRLKIGQEVLIHGYVDEIRKDTIIIQNEGGYFGTVECEVTDIEMPDTNDVLDQIRAEIEALPKTYPFINHIDTYVKEDDVKKIINKYKIESEGEQ